MQVMKHISLIISSGYTTKFTQNNCSNH